jgi:hypothetical protein
MSGKGRTDWRTTTAATADVLPGPSRSGLCLADVYEQAKLAKLDDGLVDDLHLLNNTERDKLTSSIWTWAIADASSPRRYIAV